MNKTERQIGQRGDSRGRHSGAGQCLRRSLAVAVSLVALVCVTSRLAQAQEPFSGDWAIAFERDTDNVRVTLYTHSAVSGNGTSTLILPSGNLQGLIGSQPLASRVPVTFSLAREAGTFVFEGFIKDERGTGQWRLTPDQDFIAKMRSLRYDHLYEHQLLVAAIYDLNTKYIAELKGAGYDHPPIDQLTGAVMFDVSIKYIRELQSLGLKDLSIDKLISMRMFAVAPLYVRELRAQGYYSLSADELIAMRINGVTTEFISELGAQGYKNISANDLVRMRMFGVDAGFIGQVRKNGLKDLTIDQLVGLRFYSFAK